MVLTSDVKDLDAEISQRKNQMSSLETELKETNMTEFMVLPADAVKEGMLHKKKMYFKCYRKSLNSCYKLGYI